MKRFITFSIVFALVCAAAFAEVKVSAGASMSFTPIGAVIPDDEDAGLVAGFGKNNGNAWELQLNVEGSTENGKAGFLFQWRPKVQNGVFTGINDIGDNAGIWYKPLDIIRIDAGRFQNNDIRGRMGSGAWYGDYTIPRGGENDIFQNFDAKNGAMLTVKPIDGLSVYALVNAIPPYENTNTGTPPTAWAGPNQGAAKAFGYVWENTQVAVAYAIPNIGLARLQYVGAHPAVTADAGNFTFSITAPHIGIAFAYTGFEGLTVDVGGKIYLPVKEATSDNPWADSSSTKFQLSGADVTYQKPFMAALGVQYKTGPLTAVFRFDAQFAGSVDIDAPGWDPINLGMELRPWITVGYAINDTFTAQAEGGIVYTGESTMDGDAVLSGALRYGFGAGLQTTLAPSCYIRTGITYAGGEAPGGIPAGKTDPEPTKRNGQFSVPIIFSVSF